jgi:hypothetical protein
VGFENNPWASIAVNKDPADGRTYIRTTQPRRTLNRVCKIPAEYLYGSVPKSWGYESPATLYPDLWMAATVHCSSGVAPNASVDSPLPLPELAPSCYSGKMGVAQHAIQGAQLGLQKTRKLIEKLNADIQETLNMCNVAEADQRKAETLRAHKRLIGRITTGLQIATAVATLAVVPAAGAAGTPSLLGALGGTEPLTGAAVGDLTGAQLGTLGLAGGSTLASIGANLEARFNAEANDADQKFSQDLALNQCWFQYHTQIRETAQNVTDIKLALNAIDTQRASLQVLVDENEQARLDGHAKIIAEQTRHYPSYSHNYWFDEKAERFKKELEWARRLAYLAMEAVEYEFQQSLPFRHDILAAKSPDQLDDVIGGLKQEQAGRSLNRRRPEESSLVMSLRDDVLHISDRSKETSSGERAWSPAQRMQGRLSASSYAYFGDDGRYMGQAVPFTLTPDGILESRCGERLWRVTATVQGDGLSDGAPNTPLLLLKKNTFSSQWCHTEGDQRLGMQSGKVYPSEQLFKPGTAVKIGDATETTAALLTPWFNIRRTDFYKDTYRDGASEELAGRGLYGEYVLLFPKQMLDRGFPIEKVEDVLLRIDYLSVDNLSQ